MCKLCGAGLKLNICKSLKVLRAGPRLGSLPDKCNAPLLYLVVGMAPSQRLPLLWDSVTTRKGAIVGL